MELATRLHGQYIRSHYTEVKYFFYHCFSHTQKELHITFWNKEEEAFFWENSERPSKNKELTRIEGGVTRFIEKSRLGIIYLFSSLCKVTMTMSS